MYTIFSITGMISHHDMGIFGDAILMSAVLAIKIQKYATVKNYFVGDFITKYELTHLY